MSTKAFVHRIGFVCRIETRQDDNGLWTASVVGHFSTFGVTEGNAIRNACAPVDKEQAQQALHEYLAHRDNKLRHDDYIAAIVQRHHRNLALMWLDAYEHGELG